MAVKEIMGIKVHPAANAFPLLTGKDFNQLVKSVEKHGLRNGILLKHPPEMGGKKFPCILLDGRNRLRAWERLVKDGKVRRSEWKDNVCYADHLIDTDDEAAVRQLIHDLNIHRRHLTADQKAAATAILNGKKWDDEKGKAGRPNKSRTDSSGISTNTKTGRIDAESTKEKLAKLAGVSVAAAKRIEYIRNAEKEKRCPAGTLQKIADGELKAIDVEREIKKKAKKAPAKSKPAKAKAKPKKEGKTKGQLRKDLLDLVADWKNADHSLTELKALLLKLADRCD